MSIKKIAVRLVSLLFVVIGFSACGEKYTDEELITAAKPLVERSGLINDIFYGEGMPYVSGNLENGAASTGNYSPIDPMYLDKIGVKNVEELKKLTSEVYSLGVCNVIYTTKLSSVGDGSSIAGYAEYVELPAGFCIYTKRTNYINAEAHFHTDTLTVVKNTKNIKVLKMDVTLTQGEEIQQRQKEFRIVNENGVWKLDSMTYIAWDDEFVTE